MINYDENLLNEIIQNALTNGEEYVGIKEMLNYQARICRMCYDSFRAQGFSQDQSFDAALNLVITLFENGLKEGSH